jgi:hypothetical protein
LSRTTFAYKNIPNEKLSGKLSVLYNVYEELNSGADYLSRCPSPF